MPMKIEKITANFGQKKIFHMTSSEKKEVKISGKEGESQVLAYIEDYVTQGGFKIVSVFSVMAGISSYILTKD